MTSTCLMTFLHSFRVLNALDGSRRAHQSFLGMPVPYWLPLVAENKTTVCGNVVRNNTNDRVYQNIDSSARVIVKVNRLRMILLLNYTVVVTRVLFIDRNYVLKTVSDPREL